MLRPHRSRDAVTLVHSTVERALPHLAVGQPADGMLLLKGSIVAARLGQAADVVALQAEALDVPGRRVLPPADAIVIGGASGAVTRTGSSASAG